MGDLICNQPANYRYTWPGKDEAYICMQHAPALKRVAVAIGLHLQLTYCQPGDSNYGDCTQHISVSDWRCHICDEVRPDEKISVLTKPIKILQPMVEANENIRYCNDKESCIEGVKTFSFFQSVSQKSDEETDSSP